MLVQVYIAKLGTASVAANAVSNSIFSVLYAAPSAVATLAVTIVGQCIGAGEKKLARRYGRSMVWLCTVLVLLSLAIGMPCIPLLLKLYQAQAETVPMIYRVLIIAAVSMPFFWGHPVCFLLSCVRRVMRPTRPTFLLLRCGWFVSDWAT